MNLVLCVYVCERRQGTTQKSRYEDTPTLFTKDFEASKKLRAGWKLNWTRSRSQGRNVLWGELVQALSHKAHL